VPVYIYAPYWKHLSFVTFFQAGKFYKNWHPHTIHISKQDSGQTIGFFLRIHTAQVTTYSGLFLYDRALQHLAVWVTSTFYFVQQCDRALFVYKNKRGKEPTQSPLPSDRDSWKFLCIAFLRNTFLMLLWNFDGLRLVICKELSLTVSLVGCYGQALYSNTCVLSSLVN